MESSYVFNETTLKRVPQFMVLIIILLLGLPYVGVNMGLDLSNIAHKINQSNEFASHISESQVRGYLRQILLQWSGFSLAVVTVLLSFTQYKLANDKIALIIGLSVLFSGSVSAFHTLLIDGLSLDFTNKNNLDVLIWTFSNSISGLILLFGLGIVLVNKNKEDLNLTTFILLTTLLVLIAVTIIYYSASVIHVPTMLFEGLFISRPYELFTVFIYLALILFVYPKIYKTYPNILTDSIFYMAITQIVLSIYLMVISNTPYDSGYNIAYFLKIIAYFIPCTCLLINYIYSYTAVLNGQKTLKIRQLELAYLASHDPLTQLFNRREFEEILEKSIANSTRNKTTMALLLLDIDNFKAVNDSYGHINGDELLKQFARRLILLIRKGDLPSRVGGDEFTLILLNIKSPSAARLLSERILNELNHPYSINGKLITMTVSIGIAIYPGDGDTPEDLFQNADLAMYKAKNTGKNTYHFYTEQLALQQFRESEIEAHLRAALRENELTINYLPRYNLSTRKLIGAEILLRWTNSTLGEVSPNEFIPIAESSGLIIELGNWVLHKSLEQIVNWYKKYNITLFFSINISPVQLSSHQFLPHFECILDEFKYPPDHLELEITESLLIGNNDEITNILDNINKIGIKISLNDFGKGYSSLNRLKHLPIHTLKIDKDFVADIHYIKQKVTVIDIIIQLAHELGLSIVAEGIENEAQYKYLTSRKCSSGQGIYFSEPLSAEEFEKLAYAAIGS